MRTLIAGGPRTGKTTLARKLDELVVLEVPHVELTPRQLGMAKGCATVLAEIEAELERRGVVIRRGLS